MYSRILFVTALFGASHAIKLGAHQDAEAIDTTDQVPTDFVATEAVEGVKDTAKLGEVEYQGTEEYMQGKTGEYTAEDGTTFVTGAKEQDSQSSVRNDDGMVAQQSFSWDPSAGMIKAPEPIPEPEPVPEPIPEPEPVPEPIPEPEPSSESEETETCSEDEDCGCCAQDVCPDLTYYDQQIAKQAADFMAHVRAGKAEVEYNLSEHEKEEFEDELTKDMMKDLADKMIKDPELIDSIPQTVADMSAIEAMKE